VRTDLPALLRLTELADYIVPFAIRVVADLGVADQLAGGPLAVEELARAVGAHAPSLRRVLRLLVQQEIFAEPEPGLFALAPLGAPLRSDHPASLRHAFPLLRADVEAWARFDHTLASGKAAFDFVHGRGYYDHLAAHPDMGARLDRAVQATNPLLVRSLSRIYDWSACGELVDVGGGNGAFLAGLLQRHPSLRGVLFDRAHVVAGAAAVLREAGVADRCRVVEGDFFAAVPAGAGGYLLKTILHDWADEPARRLLGVVRAAAGHGSRLLVLEALLPPLDQFDIGKLMDVHSLALAAGPDRDLDQLQALLASAGFRLHAVHRSSSAMTLLEARPQA
jgi:hypothetical protein